MGYSPWKCFSRPVMAMSNRNNRRSVYNTVARGAKRYGPMIVKAASKAYKSYRSAPRESDVNQTVSLQHDFNSQYSRRRAPRRVVRRAKRQSNMFARQLGKNAAQYSRVFNAIYAPATVTPTSFADSQTTFNVGIYGGKVSSSTLMDAWYQIVNDGTLLVNTGKIFCKSAVLDCQILNTDSTNVLVVDAYKYVARREGYDEPNLEWSQALVNQLSATGSSNDLTQNSLECTPFDAPGFGSKYLITGKVRYRIAPNNSVYLQMRDPRKYCFHTARFDYDASVPGPRVQMFKGMTKGWIFVARSANTDATSAFLGPINWKVIQTQSYHYAFVEATDDRQGQN